MIAEPECKGCRANVHVRPDSIERIRRITQWHEQLQLRWMLP